MSFQRICTHPISLQLASPDVIHSFYLPNLRVKQDAMPGMINRAWFQAKETGDFDIACAQHCGTHHYKMKGTLMIQSRDDFEAWYRESSAAAALAVNPADIDSLWGWEWKKL